MERKTSDRSGIRAGNLSVFVVSMDVGWETTIHDLPPLMIASTKATTTIVECFFKSEPTEATR
jgi:hypothetical protein